MERPLLAHEKTEGFLSLTAKIVRGRLEDNTSEAAPLLWLPVEVGVTHRR